MATLDEIVVKLKADVGQFQKSFKSADRSVKTFAARSGRALKGLQRRLTSLRRSLLSMKSAFLAVGGVLLARSFIKAASDAEQYRLRLNAALKSTKEGGRVFRDMAKFAGSVSFEFDEIMRNATNLAGVVKDGADDIKKFMPIIGDLAALTGLTMEETTGQFIRMMSAGAAAADMFRERGVLQMLGFKAGVSIAAKETMDQVIREYERLDSRFRGLSATLAKTWRGMLSMMGDAWFQFRLGVMQGGLFDAIKAGMSSMVDSSKEDLDEWVEIGRAASRKLFNAFKAAFLGIASAIDAVKPAFQLVSDNITDLWNWYKSLPVAVQTLGIAGMLILGPLGTAGVVAAGTVVVKALKGIKDAYNDFLESGFGKRFNALLKRDIAGELFGGGEPKDKKTPSKDFPIPIPKPDVTAILDPNSSRAAAEAFFAPIEAAFERGARETEKAMEELGAAAAKGLKEALGGAEAFETFNAARDAINEMTKALRTPQEVLDQTIAKFDELEAAIRSAFDNAEAQEFIDREALEANLETLNRARKEALEEFEKDYEGFFKDLGRFGERVAENLEDAFVEFMQGGKDAFKDFATSAIKELTRIIFRLLVLEPIVRRLKDALSGAGGISGIFGAFAGVVGGAVGGLFGGGAAAGGGGTGGSLIAGGTGLTMTAQFGTSNVKRGQPVIVGEKRPEIFVPSTGGRIEPRAKMGTTINYNIDARGAEAGVERRIIAAIQQSENRAVQRSVAAVSDERKRGGGFAAAFAA